MKNKTLATIRSAIREGEAALREAGAGQPGREARWIVQDVLGETGAALAAHPERSVPEEARASIREQLARRADGEPLAYVLGHADFRDLRLRVSPDVLIPRPETERVVEAALAACKAVASPRVLDVGTGSGCIALAVKDERPKADVYACDVSEAALDVARENADALGLGVSFSRADVLANDFSVQVGGPFDVIVSNPPYVAESDALPASVRDYEPAAALYAGHDPLRFYRALCGHAGLLREGGTLVMEIHADYGPEVVRLCEASGLRDVTLIHDLFERPRVVTARAGT